MFKEFWNKFVNTFFRDVTPALKGGTIVTLILLALICFVFAVKGKNKILVSNWMAFFFFVTFTVLAILYTFYTR